MRKPKNSGPHRSDFLIYSPPSKLIRYISTNEVSNAKRCRLCRRFLDQRNCTILGCEGHVKPRRLQMRRFRASAYIDLLKSDVLNMEQTESAIESSNLLHVSHTYLCCAEGIPPPNAHSSHGNSAGTARITITKRDVKV